MAAHRYPPQRERCPSVPSPRAWDSGTLGQKSGTALGTVAEQIDISDLISGVFERDSRRDSRGTLLSQSCPKAPLGNKRLGTAMSIDLEGVDNRELGTKSGPGMPSVRGDVGSQYPEDQACWLEASRVFGTAFPPPSDPMSPLVDQPPSLPGQAAVIRKFREDENRIRRMVETGELSTDPMPYPSRAGAYQRERRAYLAQEKRRAAEIRVHRGERLFRLPLGYEGPGNGRVRRFMTREGFVISVPRHVIEGVDSVRVTILQADDDQTVVAAYKAALADASTRQAEFPGVRREPGRIEIDCSPSYEPTIGPWARRLVADLEERGLVFEIGPDKLTFTFKGNALDDQTLGLVLPKSDVLRAVVLERS